MKHGWDYKKLGELVQVLNGYAFKSSLYENQGIRVLRITNVQKGNIVDDDPKYYPLSLTDEIRNYLLKESDLLMSLTGNVGRVGLLTKEMLPAALNQRVACLRILSNGLNLGFLFHYLNSDKFEQDAVLSAKGIAQKNMSTEWLKDYKLPLPPISVQQSIVSELDKINELIRLKKEQLKDYDNLAQSIFYEMFGDPVVNEKGWEVKKIGEVCLIERGGSPRPIKDYITEDEDGLNWIKIGDAQEGSIFINSTKEKIRKEGLKKTRMVHKGDFILSNSMSFGRPYIMGVDGCIHDGWLVLHDTNNTFNKLYLYYSLAHKSMYQQFKQMAVGGVVNNLNSEMVRRVLVLVPPLIVQQEFANRIELIEMQKKQIISTIQALETLLASRMQYWFD